MTIQYMSYNKTILLFLILFFSQNLNAQFSINSGLSPDSLARILSGSGVQIYNPVLNCATIGSGRFNNAPASLGFSSGVILTNGNANDAISPSSASTPTSGSVTDPVLAAAASGVTNDDCVLEFDIKVLGDTLEFKYVFSSEEYTQFECSGVSDLFGFFISGPNPAGGNYVNQNIAIVPGTVNTPVSIDNINGVPSCNGNNGASYNGPITNIEYNGNTVVLTAVIATMPCDTYHLKLGIADVGDQILDSGVFLEESSFVSNVASISAISSESPTLDFAVENCSNGEFIFTLPQVLSSPLTINIEVAGTAIEGTDYNFVQDSIYFPAGNTSQTITITPITDALIEGQESIVIRVLAPCDNLPYDSATLYIYDEVPFTLSPTEDTICLGQTVNVTATGASTYQWWPSGGISSTTSATPIIFPSAIDSHFVAYTLGTCVDTASVYVKVGLVNVTFLDTQITCGSTNNGSVFALGVSNVTDSSNLQYQWNAPLTDTTRYVNNLSAGTYSVTVTDHIGCTKTGNITFVNPDSLEVNFTIDSILCNGDTGSVTLTSLTENFQYDVLYVHNGTTTGPIEYTSSASGTLTFTGLSVGSYLFGVVDTAGSCSDSISFTLNEPTAINIIADTTNVLCNSDSSGLAYVVVSGGISPYTYLWNTGSTNDSISNLIAGNYSVVVTDANGCTDSVAFLIAQPDTLVLSLDSTINARCFGMATGDAFVSTLGGSNPYNYSWSNASTNEDLIDVVAGNYQLVVTDDNACTDTLDITISQADSLQFSMLADSSSCLANDALAYVDTAFGGIAPYAYLWEDNSINDSLSNIAPGWHTVTVTDDSLCSFTDSIQVFGPPMLVLNKDSLNVLCFGGNTGQAEVIFVNGTLPLTYSWSNSQTTDTAFNLIAGNYSVIVTDNESCTDTLSFNIQEPNLLQVNTIDSSNVLCNGDSSGYAFATPIGGIAPFTYQWNDYANQTNDTAFNLPIGVYTVIITDSNNCTTTDSVEVFEPTILEIPIIDSFNVFCNGDSTGYVFATANGGTAPYNFQWNDFNNQANDTAFNLPIGTYTVTLTDANNCTIQDSTTIIEPTALEVQTIDSFNVSCFGLSDGYVFAEANGGTAPYTYVWNDVANTANDTAFNLPIGTYTVTITDALGCTIIDSVIVNQPDTLIVSVIDSVNVLCFGENNGLVFAEGQGGILPYSFQWNDGGNTTNDTAFNLLAGTYTVVITDDNGCTATDSVAVNQPDSFIVNNIGFDSVSCFGLNDGMVFSSAMGGILPHSLVWNDALNTTNDTILNLPAGVYTVTYTDNNNCTAIDSVELFQPDSLIYSVANITDVACFGDSTGIVSTTTTGGTMPYNYVWSNTTTNADLTNVAIGTYTSVVTDFNGCIDSLSATVVQNNLIQITFGFDTTSCSYDDGRAYLDTIIGGVAPYTYHWVNPFSTNDTLSNLAPGFYLFEVTDAMGCVMLDSAEVLPPALFSKDSSNVSCYGGSDGWASVTPLYGTPPYTYNWSNGVSGIDSIGNLIAGQYQILVTNSEGCIDSAIFNISQPDSLDVNLTQDSVLCFGGNTGQIQAQVVGGTLPYAYAWNDALNQTTDTAFNLTAGLYTLTVSDVHTCMIIDSIPVLQPDSAFLIVDSITNVLCNGDATGEIFTSTIGGTMPYTYAWNSSQTTEDISNLPIGNYILTATDNNACVYTLDTVISEPLALAITMGMDSVLCNGDSSGIAFTQVSGGVMPYTYTWNDINIQTNDTAFNLPIGMFTVITTDSNNCTITDSVEVFEPTPLQVVLGKRNVLCFSDSTGYAFANISGGTAPYSYSWNDVNVQTNDTAFNLPIGMFTVTITDAKGCSIIDSIQIVEPTELLITMFADSVNCFGNNDGFAWVDATGGTDSLGLYNYNWSNGQTTDTAFNLIAGNYIVVVTDSLGCSKTDSIIVQEPTLLDIVVDSVLNVDCNANATGSIFTTTTGGTAGYTYAWDNTAQTTEDVTNLTAQTYQVIVTDTKGCLDTTTATVTEPNALAINSGTDSVLCHNGSDGIAFTNVNGGTTPYTYLWNDVATSTNDTAFALLIGTYIVNVTDSQNCTIADTVQVFQPDSIVIAFDVHNVTCLNYNDGFVVASVSSGGTAPFTFTWSNAQVNDTALNLTEGTYWVQVEDANGCQNWDTVYISEPTGLQIDTVLQDSVLCFGANTGSAIVVASGGTTPYTYLWNDALAQTTDTATNVLAGWIVIQVTDSNNCTATDSVEILEPTLLDIVVDSVLNVDCNANATGSIFTTTTGGTAGYNYAWDNTTQTTEDVTNLTAQIYQVIVTDTKGCLDTTMATVTEPNALAINSGTDSVLCHNGSDGIAFTNVNGGTTPYTYLWNDVATSTNDTAFALPIGTYIVNVTDSQNCTIADTVQVFQPDSMILAFNKTNVTCFNGNDGTAIVNVASGGTNPFNYVWETGQIIDTATNLSVGTYWVQVTDVNGCIDTQNVTIDQPVSLLASTISNVEDVKCNGEANGNATVNGVGGQAPYNYVWSNTQTNATLTNVVIGTYTVTVTDDWGCSVEDTVTIAEPPVLVIDNLDVDSVHCFGEDNGEITVFANGGTPNYQYSLDGTDYSSLDNFNGLVAGNYDVFVRDANGCLVQMNADVFEPEMMTISINPDETTINLTDEVELSVIVDVPYSLNDITSYLWLPNEHIDCNGCANPKVSPFETTEYDVTVTYTQYYCEATATAIINVNDIEIDLATGFSPNGDGHNDVIHIMGKGLESFEWTIYDRWGELIFVSTEQKTGWDGTYKGTNVEVGVYVYYVNGFMVDGSKVNKQGSITLIR